MFKSSLELASAFYLFPLGDFCFYPLLICLIIILSVENNCPDVLTKRGRLNKKKAMFDTSKCACKKITNLQCITLDLKIDECEEYFFIVVSLLEYD